MAPSEGDAPLAEDLLWSEVLSTFLEPPSPPSAAAAARVRRASPPSGPGSPPGSRGLSPSADAPVSEWSRPLVAKSFCRHQHREYTVHVANDLFKGEAFGRLRRPGYGAQLKGKRPQLLAASSQFGFPGIEFISRANCADVARRRNLAPTLERFPVLKLAGVRPPLGDLDEIDAADAAAAWSNPQKPKVQESISREPRFNLDRPWLPAANRRPRLLERQVGGLCEASDEEHYHASAPSNRHSGPAPPSRVKTAPGEAPTLKIPDWNPQHKHEKPAEKEEPEKSLKSKLKDKLRQQMDQRDVVQELTSEARRRRSSDSRGLRFHLDAAAGGSTEVSSKKGLWRLHHKDSKSSRLYRVTTCRRMKDQSEDVLTGYRDRVNRYEAEVAQESFLRYFPTKNGNPWSNEKILEALADFGLKAQSRTEKIALNTVLTENEENTFGFNAFCSLIEEARCKLRASRTHQVFQVFKYADKEDLGALNVDAVMKCLQDLNLAFEKDSLERQAVEAMVRDCYHDPVTGLIALSEVEFLVSAVREFMVQSKRRRERELKVEYQLPDALFHQFRSQLIRFHKSFKELDDDDSGKLDPAEAMNLLTHFGCITSGMPLDKKLRAQAIVSRHLLDSEEHLLSFDRFLCVVQDLRVLGMEEKVEIVHSHFNQYDRDQVGLLPIKDICQILLDLRIQPRSLSEQEAMAQLIEEADSGSGRLTVEDLLLLVQRILERIGELNRQELLSKAEALGFTSKQASALWETFEALDVSQDGLMDVMEVGQALSLMKWQISANKLQRHVDDLDADGNGQLDFMEFLHLMRRMLDDVQTPVMKKSGEEPVLPRRSSMLEEDPTGEGTASPRRGRGAITSSSPAAPKKR